MLGAVAPDLPVPPEITTDLRAMRAAQANLREQSVLQTAAGGALNLAPEIEALIRPAAYPTHVVVANISDNAKGGKLARIVCFNWTPEAMVVNWVDEVGDHHFESYASQDAQTCVWDHLSRLCDLNIEEPTAALANLTRDEAERLMKEMRQAVLLMAVSDVQSPQKVARALSWFVSGRHAWLMQKNDHGEQAVPRPTSQADLAHAVSELVDQTVSGQA